MKYYYGTKDSYHEGGTYTATPEELAEVIKKEEYNRYNGGEPDSVSATIDCFKPGFIFNKNIVIKGTQTEFKEFENLIKNDMEYFTPRNYKEDVNMNIETIKNEVQTNTHTYIMGIKPVTKETPDEVIKSIKTDVKIFGKVSDFIIRDNNKIIIRLEGNYTPCCYYFENFGVMTQVIQKLREGDIPIN